MLKAFSSFVVGILTFIMRSSSLSAEIIETHEIASVQNPIDNDSIVIFNITGTLYEPATTYADNFGLITRNHLLSIGIDFEKTLSYLHLKNHSGDDGSYSFAYGLIFTNGKPVGPAILAFLERLQSKPTKIIMSGNSRRNLENAQMALA